MKVDFSKSGAPSTPVSDPNPIAVATVSSNPVPTPYSDENIGLKDIILPRINIVQKVGDLSNIFEHGSILINGEQVIYTCNKDPKTPNPPLTVLVIGLQAPKYVEKVEGGARGDSYNTPQEVVAAGGTIDWNDHKATSKPLYQESRTALILLEKPEGVDETHFPHTFDGKKYCTALWTMKGTAYTHGAKVFLTAKQIGALRPVEKGGKGGYRAMFYTLGTKLANQTINGKVQWYYIPVLKPGADTSEEFRKWLADDVVGF